MGATWNQARCSLGKLLFLAYYLPSVLTSPVGILVVDKPAKISCAQLLNCMKRLLPRKTKIGHAGTLDPLATGVLLVLVGRGATRRCEQLMGQPKQYRAVIRLGATTRTLDADEPETQDINPAIPTLEQIYQVLPRFIGTIQQVPPIFSALKRGGRPLYELARKGQDIQLEPRPVQVYGIELLGYAYPHLEIMVHCGRGTYIRSLARDIARELGTSGYLWSLCRTAVGPYTLDKAIPFAQLTVESLGANLIT